MRSGTTYDIGRVILLVALTVCGGVYVKLIGDVPQERVDSLIPLFCVVFSVLAGFALAVMTLCGKFDSALERLNERQLRLYQTTYKNRMLRHAFICAWCMGVVALALLLPCLSGSVFDWAKRCFAFAATFGLGLSLLLPVDVYRLFADRYDFMVFLKEHEDTQRH